MRDLLFFCLCAAVAAGSIALASVWPAGEAGRPAEKAPSSSGQAAAASTPR